ncbi:unnamed protein product [Zymoseptoria tritici ST99CH_1A5]|uniref:Uncharacterized protein n=1 Tax=Zymoseptoria tritici ST99CH_1A5 TaxID=1276529 RepID=A0A1Y6LBW1_ZYMTR|nr:unnamed protein product [Zymoseptoria tritici ST99CH_1A5]
MANLVAQAALPANYERRQTVTEQLDRLPHVTEEEREQIIDQIQEQSRDYKGFRHDSAATQNRKNHHLEQYTKWLLFLERRELEDFADEDELDEWRFPTNPDEHERMFEHFRQFLLFVFKAAEPRSRTSGQYIKYQTLVQYRESLVFWVRHKARMRDAPFPSSKMRYVMTEAMRAVVMAHPNEPASDAEKAFLGLGELRELFDYDMVHNKSIEYAEQQWAAWCLGRCTACRPGSICKASSHTNNLPLLWDRLEFLAGDEPGMWDLIVHFRNIRIKQPLDPEKALGQGDGSFRVTIKCPDANNLIFSPAHRLLVIALRRGLLAGIETIEDLINCDLARVPFKPEAATQPLFFRGRAKGAGLDTSSPLTSHALADYLRKTGHKVGWNFTTMGFGPIRRRALTDIVARVGLAQARRIAGHAPDTFTLEKYYLQLAPIYQQTETLLEQDIAPGGFSDQARRNWAPLVTGKLTDERLRRTRGNALLTMTNRLALADENPPEDFSTDARRQYRKRLRRFAHQALLEHERAQQQRELTREEAQRRTAAISASSFADAVVARALALQHAREVSGGDENEDVDMDNDNEYEDWDGFEEEGDGNDFDQDDMTEEQDLEDAAREQETDSMTIPAETDENGASDSASLPYRDQATAFMEMLLENTMNNVEEWSERDKTCPECYEDDTVPSERKNFEYASALHLNNHLSSNYHSLESGFRRAADARYNNTEDEGYICVYCEQAEEDRTKHFQDLMADPPSASFPLLRDLIKHVKESNAAIDGHKHDELKELAGWYDSSMAKKVDPQSAIKKQQLGAKNLKAMGIELIKVNTADGTQPHPARPGLVKGKKNPEPDPPARFSTSLSIGQPAPQLPVKFATSLQYGPVPIDSGIPAAFQNSLSSGTTPQPARSSEQSSAPQPPPAFATQALRRRSAGAGTVRRPSRLSQTVVLSSEPSAEANDDDDDDDEESGDAEDDEDNDVFAP